MTNPINWNCSICTTNESFPMMIVLCGHTFCENCIKKINKCPICRISFNQFDLQPNYAVCSEQQEHARMNNENLTISFQDFIRQQKNRFRSLVHTNLQHILHQLQTQSTTESFNYICTLEPPHLSTIIIISICKHLHVMGFKTEVKLPDPVTMETPVLAISINPDILESDNNAILPVVNHVDPLPAHNNQLATRRRQQEQSSQLRQESQLDIPPPLEQTVAHLIISQPENRTRLDNNQRQLMYNEFINSLARMSLFTGSGFDEQSE